nr:transposase [Glycomyces arizonensis]
MRQHTYTELKDRGLGSQVAQLLIKKTCHAYATLAGLVKAGRPQGERAAKATAKPVVFRPDAAQAFDDRCLSWQHDAGTVSIWTVTGRMRNLAFTGHRDHLKVVEQYRQGESDLVFRDGNWYLMATVEVADAEANTDSVDFLGVDMGIVNIATSSDGDNYSGASLRRYRKRMAKVRAELQAKATKSAKRKLKARARREARAVEDVNHRISKQPVTQAERPRPSPTATRTGGRCAAASHVSAASAWKTLPVSATGYGSQPPGEASSTHGPSTNSRRSSPARRSGPACRWRPSMPGTRRGGARGAGALRRPIGPLVITSPVSAADSLGPPTRWPRSTFVPAHA